MAVNEYPGKADHYRMCLSVIADAPGEERPGLKQFLQTGSRGKLHATYSIGHVSKVTTQNPMYPLEKIFLQDCKTLGECIKTVKRHNKNSKQTCTETPVTSIPYCNTCTQLNPLEKLF